MLPKVCTRCNNEPSAPASLRSVFFMRIQQGATPPHVSVPPFPKAAFDSTQLSYQAITSFQGGALCQCIAGAAGCGITSLSGLLPIKQRPFLLCYSLSCACADSLQASKSEACAGRVPRAGDEAPKRRRLQEHERWVLIPGAPKAKTSRRVRSQATSADGGLPVYA